jgi:predicted negative regulator of RcsB-dependent stress response
MRLTARAATCGAGERIAEITSKNEDMTTRHPSARRVHRPDTEPDDAFVASVLETTAWARKHQRVLIVGGIAAAVVVVALVLWLQSRASQREQANLQIGQVRTLVMMDNTEVAIRELEQFLAQYGGTPAADEARLLLARQYLLAGQPTQAAETVRRLAANPGRPMGADAAFLLAAAYEAGQEPHRAEEVYMRVANDGRFLFQRQEALDNSARIRTQRGDLSAAVQAYERLVEITPETSPDRQIFEMRLGEARAAAANPGQAPATAPAADPAGAPAAPPAPGTEPEAATPPAGQGTGGPQTAPAGG